ncbi:NAD(P)H-binding protein [Nocardia inohanensis]|uniref:NAD(P)H-binding protein n=1 Tax=Nocardia inohanensis TaxID=209246 RepID=UPI000833E977|nr:NAD(P)H-binding protein [Nocardia inohanensis]
MTTLVIGARGKIGQTVIDRLHAAGLPVRAASAAPTEVTVPSGVEVAELRLDAPETFTAALKDVRQVFLYAEPAGIDAFVTAARAAGVEHIVLMSSSSVLADDAESSPLAAHHLAVEKALAASGLTVTVLRPGAFASNSLGWAYFIGNDLPIEHPYPDARIAPVHPADIADVAVAALIGDIAPGGAFYLTGAEQLSFREQLAILGEAIGREIPIVEISREAALEQMGRQMPTTLATSLLDYWASATATPENVADTTESVLGTPARSFAQWARENASAFSRS